MPLLINGTDFAVKDTVIQGFRKLLRFLEIARSSRVPLRTIEYGLAVPDMHLHPVAIELGFVDPAVSYRGFSETQLAELRLNITLRRAILFFSRRTPLNFPMSFFLVNEFSGLYRPRFRFLTRQP